MKNKIKKFDNFIKKETKNRLKTFDEIINIFVNMIVDENSELNNLFEEKIENLYSDEKKIDKFYENYFEFSKDLFFYFHTAMDTIDQGGLNDFGVNLSKDLYNLIPKNKKQEYILKGVRTILMTLVSQYNINIRDDDDFMRTVKIAFDNNENLKALFSMLFMFSNQNAQNPDVQIPEQVLMETLNMLFLTVLFSMIHRVLHEEETKPKAVNNTKSKGTWRENPSIYQLKISIKGAKPPIWRRVLVESDYTFYDLHNIIQHIFNWQDYHMYEFYGNFGNYCSGELIEEDYGYNNLRNYPSDDITLDMEFKNEKDKIKYTYDFGDDWNHEIVVEKILVFDDKERYPKCTAGRRNGPMEDCGGIWGYSEIVYALENDDYIDVQHLLDEDNEFYYKDFDPTYFNKDLINKSLQNR